jgi:toxin ParE1/3/4
VARSSAQLLLDVIDEAVTNISLLPDVWPMWPGRRDVHCRVLPKWRYSIIYTVDAESVFIVALAHHKRRLGYWLSRL